MFFSITAELKTSLHKDLGKKCQHLRIQAFLLYLLEVTPLFGQDYLVENELK